MKNDIECLTQRLHDLLQQALAVEEALSRALASSETSEAGGAENAKAAVAVKVSPGDPRPSELPPPPETAPKDMEAEASSPEEAATALLDSANATTATAARIEATRAKAEKLLEQIQYAAGDGRDTSSLETDVLLLVGDEAPAWRARIDVARQKGLDAKREREHLAATLKNGVCSEAMTQYWRALPARAGWFERKAVRQIVWKLGKDLEQTYKTGGLDKAEALLRQARQLYGAAVKSVTIPDDWRSAKPPVMPAVVRETLHTLSSRKPVAEWNIYIDETGVRFSEEGLGKEGYVVAVCVRQGSALPDLGRFHSTNAGAAEVLKHCNTLLRSDCGILGFTCSALGIKSREGWLQAIRELVKWVWRLLPLQANGEPVVLRYHVEQRAEYSEKLSTELGEKMLIAELARENPQRAQKMRVLSFVFENKDAPMLAWADIVACLWGKIDHAGTSFRRESGLVGTCLVSCSSQSLKTCEVIFSGGLPDGAAWIELMREKTPKNSLQQQALERLQQRCHADPQQWETYSRAMQAYLAGKQYSLDVLERMSDWLRPMRSPSLAAKFFWNMAELARCNHMGDVGSAKMLDNVTELQRLAPEMGKLLPEAPLHAALRLAVADSNAFEFARAEARLAQWNPSAGGRLTDSALWDGKILSSLGQYRAFQQDPVGGARLFQQALEQFDALAAADADEARRQQAQTRTYLAVARMDSPNAEAALVRSSVEEALGMSIADAAEQWGREPVEGSPYPHYLLARYLAYTGTDEERKPYIRRSDLWTDAEKGFGSGHPWPQIQYFRWLMTDEDDAGLRQALANSLSSALGRDNMPTVELIGLAIAISMNVLQPAEHAVRAKLLQLEAQLSGADAIVRQLAAAESGDKLLAKRVIPFNFC